MTYQYGKPKKRRSVKPLLWLLFIVAAVLYSILVASWWAEGSSRRDAGLHEHCQQYKAIPEEHLDRVPDGCVPIYFEGR
jgi:hypothetical protein